MQKKIFNGGEIFEKNYRDYCTKIAEKDFERIKDILGADIKNGNLIIKLIDHNYYISKSGITDKAGYIPDYRTCIILSKYILLAPEKVYSDFEWVSFKDFKRESHFTNVNFFSSDVENAVIRYFSGKKEKLAEACKKAGGTVPDINLSYDVIMEFVVLPRVSVLLLFNDIDEGFPAQAKVLFHKHSEYYLDPESIAISGAMLVKKITTISE